MPTYQVTQSKVTTNECPLVFQTGTGKAFNGQTITYEFDVIPPNTLRDVADKITGTTGEEWILVESDINQCITHMDFKSPFSWSVLPSAGAVTKTHYPSPLLKNSSYPNIVTSASYLKMTSIGGRIKGSAALATFPTVVNGAATFSILAQKENDDSIIGIHLTDYDNGDDFDIKVGLVPATGHLELKSATNCNDGDIPFASGSYLFRDEDDVDWYYFWFRFNPNVDLNSLGEVIIYPVATTGSVQNPWGGQEAVNRAVVLAHPQLVCLNDSDSYAYPGTISVFPSSSNKPRDIVKPDFTPAIEGTRITLKCIPSYSSSLPNRDLPLINYDFYPYGLELTSSVSPGNRDFQFGTYSPSIRTSTGVHKASFNVSWQDGEKLQMEIDWTNSVVSWSQSSGYQNTWAFTGNWTAASNKSFTLGTSGSSKQAFDGLLCIKSDS